MKGQALYGEEVASSKKGCHFNYLCESRLPPCVCFRAFVTLLAPVPLFKARRVDTLQC